MSAYQTHVWSLALALFCDLGCWDLNGMPFPRSQVEVPRLQRGELGRVTKVHLKTVWRWLLWTIYVMTLNPVSMAKRVPSLILSIIHYFSLSFACLPVRVSIQQNFQSLALPWSHHFSLSGVGCTLVCLVWWIILTLVRIREEHLFTFISSTRCLKAEFFKLDLRLNAQQTPESVMAGLNNSEQFLWRPWGKEFIQGILQPPKGSLPRRNLPKLWTFFLRGGGVGGGSTTFHSLLRCFLDAINLRTTQPS